MSGTRMSTTRAQHSFARIPSVGIQRSVFDRSCGVKTTFNAGLLVPVFVDEALPGDTMQMSATCFGRLATLLRPIMDNLYLDVFFFAVPNRLVWDNWKKMNGEQVNPGDSTSFLVPQVTPPAAGWQENSLGDYFGIPTKVAGVVVSALPFRAYNLVYNEWFRDENLINSVTVAKTDGPDVDTLYTVRRRGKRHDYFTSCLPWPQKGTAVSLPLGSLANVVSGASEHTTGSYGNPVKGRTTAAGAQPSNTQLQFGSTAGQVVSAGTGNTGTSGIYFSNLYADLSTATAATINQLRESFQIQRLLERDARGGTRYTEVIRSHFGVVSPDARLQRPEYLGGGTIRVNVNPIANTAFNSTESAALGDLGAIGTFTAGHVGFRQSFTEHCVVLGLACLRADLNYQQGLERMWSRRTRFDFYWPALAHLGEQAVLNKEIYAQGTSPDTSTFGYQERWAEYRYKPSLVTGRFRSNATTTLDSWHLAQNFTGLPALNQSFIEENPPVDRVVAVSGGVEPHVLSDWFFSFKCARPMPVFSVPGLIDHF